MTTAVDCTPVSWLRLERYALGDLDPKERQDIAAHLTTCARCRACAESITTDPSSALPPLPALPSRRIARGWPWAWFTPARFAQAAVTSIAIVASLWALRSGEPVPKTAPRVVAIKGGDVAVELVREHQGSNAWEPTSFATGDRFKVLLTCAPPLQVHADILVLQSDGPTFVGVGAPITCGNRVPVPPAFTITGPGAARVCVSLDGTAPPSRTLLPDGAPLGAHTCLSLARTD